MVVLLSIPCGSPTQRRHVWNLTRPGHHLTRGPFRTRPSHWVKSSSTTEPVVAQHNSQLSFFNASHSIRTDLSMAESSSHTSYAIPAYAALVEHLRWIDRGSIESQQFWFGCPRTRRCRFMALLWSISSFIVTHGI